MKLICFFHLNSAIYFYNKLMQQNVYQAYGEGIRTHNLQNMSLFP